MKLWERVDHLLLLSADRKYLEQGRSTLEKYVRCVPEKRGCSYPLLFPHCIVEIIWQLEYNKREKLKKVFLTFKVSYPVLHAAAFLCLPTEWRIFATLFPSLDSPDVFVIPCFSWCVTKPSKWKLQACSILLHNGPVLPGFGMGLPESQPYQDPMSVYR